MRPRLAAAVACASVLLLLLAGCASSLTAEAEKTLQSGGAAEVNLRMAKGDRIDYAWNATAPLEFNIHTHGASGVQDFVTEQSTAKAGFFEAPADGVYSLLWVNKATRPITLDYKVTGSAELLA